jgi:hypothetical protein
MSVDYVGSPWRSRFLRSPKIALALASREDFVPLGSLAFVRLGLKTGADRFFFLTPLPQAPSLDGGLGLRMARTMRMRGLDGWEGELDARDLLPVIRNPHELQQEDDRRRLAIPRSTPAFYLFPRDRRPEAHLADYIRLGEQEGIHQQALVRANAGRHWYRQTRAVQRPQWALPYNSAYDYGAWHNHSGAVINGRFVGVTAATDVDSLLLGAALNTTWVMATRLLEGVATGVEGAFDVGPVAARFTVVPDVRAFLPEQVGGVRQVFDGLLRENVMPAAPDRNGHVVEARHALDLAVMLALGLTAGEASSLAGSLYENYGRWRRAVEDVERRMRVFRGAMARAGTGRGATPAVAAARRVWEELEPDFPAVPRGLLHDDDVLERLDISGRVDVRLDRPLLDANLATTREGATEDLGSWERVRYLGMLVTIGFRSPFALPVNGERAASIVTAHEQYVGDLRFRARERATSFVAEQALDEVVQAVERHWHRKSRAAGQGVVRIGVFDSEPPRH